MRRSAALAALVAIGLAPGAVLRADDVGDPLLIENADRDDVLATHELVEKGLDRLILGLEEMVLQGLCELIRVLLVLAPRIVLQVGTELDGDGLRILVGSTQSVRELSRRRRASFRQHETTHADRRTEQDDQRQQCAQESCADGQDEPRLERPSTTVTSAERSRICTSVTGSTWAA